MYRFRYETAMTQPTQLDGFHIYVGQLWLNNSNPGWHSNLFLPCVGLSVHAFEQHPHSQALLGQFASASCSGVSGGCLCQLDFSRCRGSGPKQLVDVTTERLRSLHVNSSLVGTMFLGDHYTQ